MRVAEKELAQFYQENPYLIAKELGDRSVLAEQVIGRHRLDLLIKRANGAHTIIEFKREPLQSADVLQLTRYWRVWKKTHRLGAKHYLVGLRPRDPEKLWIQVEKAPMKIIIRVIPDDVPAVVRWSEQLRRYVRYEEGDPGAPLELFVGR
jgi:Endonuclease NucS